MRARYALMIMTLMGSGACGVLGEREYQLYARSSQEPEEMTLRELIKRGPQGNPNVVITDFVIVDDYVSERKIVTGRWTKVWVPIVPVDAEKDTSDKPAAVYVFIFSSDVGNDDEVQKRFNQPKLRGLINADAPKPGIIGSSLLKKRYPGTEPSKCIVLEEGRKPAGVLKFGLLSAGFVILLLMTVAIWVLARMLDKVQVDPKPIGGKRGDVRQPQPDRDDDYEDPGSAR